jgi:hypothetical protein
MIVIQTNIWNTTAYQVFLDREARRADRSMPMIQKYDGNGALITKRRDRYGELMQIAFAHKPTICFAHAIMNFRKVKCTSACVSPSGFRPSTVSKLTRRRGSRSKLDTRPHSVSACCRGGHVN